MYRLRDTTIVSTIWYHFGKTVDRALALQTGDPGSIPAVGGREFYFLFFSVTSIYVINRRVLVNTDRYNEQKQVVTVQTDSRKYKTYPNN